jgi:elongation factor P hydroxylase
LAHDPNDLIALFARVFGESERTRLVWGGEEPYYAPWGEGGEPAEIVFAHGFFSSALHEVAHWCVAGKERRKLPDFGYWYKPDGRTAAEQREFEQVEVKPQALEWIFSRAAGIRFNFSADNLSADATADHSAWRLFQENVAAQARRYTAKMPDRAGRFASALAETYGTRDAWQDPRGYVVE